MLQTWTITSACSVNQCATVFALLFTITIDYSPSPLYPDTEFEWPTKTGLRYEITPLESDRTIDLLLAIFHERSSFCTIFEMLRWRSLYAPERNTQPTCTRDAATDSPSVRPFHPELPPGPRGKSGCFSSLTESTSSPSCWRRLFKRCHGHGRTVTK